MTGNADTRSRGSQDAMRDKGYRDGGPVFSVAPSDRLVAYTAMVFFVVCYLFGGGPGSGGIGFTPILVAGAALLFAVTLSNGWARFQELPLLSRLAVAIPCAIPFVQLIPLPPSLLEAMPVQALRHQAMVAVGMGQSWTPLSVTPVDTLYGAAVAVLMLGLFVAVIQIERKSLWTLLAVVAAMIAVSAVIGVAQFLIRSPLLKFHKISHDAALIGFFANKNHMALVLSCTIPLGYELLARYLPRSSSLKFAMGFLWVAIIAMLIATNSRAGLALGLISTMIVALRIWPNRRIQVIGASLGVILLAVGLASVSTTVAAMWDRIGDAAEDGRWELFQRSLPLVWQGWPFGSGMGSFVEVYNSQERLEWVSPLFVNNAHNDYIELLVEAGLLAIVAFLLFWAGVGRAVVRSLQDGSGFGPARAGDSAVVLGLLIIVLFSAHSLVDYPLRRLATLALFVIAVGCVFRERR